MAGSPFAVRIQNEDFDVALLQRELLQGQAEEGAIVTFTGYVRTQNTGRIVHGMHLEHYPGMTEASIHAILSQAQERWQVLSALIVHRIGSLVPGDQIVWVGVASSHRADAYSACEYIMDYLKTQAPFWKKELAEDGEHWVDSRQTDSDRLARWQP